MSEPEKITFTPAERGELTVFQLMEILNQCPPMSRVYFLSSLSGAGVPENVSGAYIGMTYRPGEKPDVVLA